MSSLIQSPSLTRLPVELLSAILNEFEVYLTADGQFSSSTTHPPRALHPDIMALRSVCRLFRTLVYEMGFWYTDDVHITALLPGRQVSQIQSNWISTHHNYSFWESEVKELEEHLEDQLFVRCLGKRTKWRFKHHPFLLAILERVPLFRLNATSVILEFPHYPGDTKPSYRPYPGRLVNAAIAMLGSCRNLTSLEINPLHDELSLNLIAIVCPALKRLRINDIHVEHGHGDLGGNLDGMAGLEEIEVDDFDPYQFQDNTSVLPLSSAATLTRLSLLCRWEFNAENMCLAALDNFVNLQSLSLSPLSYKMAKWIRRANINLSDFRIILWDLGRSSEDIGGFPDANLELMISEFDQLMAAKCLRNLKEFRFALAGDSYDCMDLCLQRVHSVVKAVVKHQPLLENLVLTANSDDNSFSLLPQLVNLKALTWYCHETDDKGSSISEVKQNIQKAFQLSSAEPMVKVFPYNYWGYDFRAVVD